MKKSIMAAICAVTLLTGTAYANGYGFNEYNYSAKQYSGKYYSENEYSVAHPYYMPTKGHVYVDAGYENIKTKFKTEDGKELYPKGWNSKKYSVNGTYAMSDTWFFKLGYMQEKTKLNPDKTLIEWLTENAAELMGAELYDAYLNNEINHSEFMYYAENAYNYLVRFYDTFSTNEFKEKIWHLGFTNKFIDDEKTFGKFSINYWQNNDDNDDDKGIDVALFYGLKNKEINPYIELRYYNTFNHNSNENDGTGMATLGFYKQVNDKFGFNFGINYTQETDMEKDKYLEGVLDLRYAFTPNCALKIGYGFQLSNSHHAFIIPYYTDEEGVNFKTKSRNHFFASLMFAF